MGDFLLDLRRRAERNLRKTAEFLRFYSDMKNFEFECPEFGLVLSYCGQPELWAPYSTPDGSIFAALNGRIALNAADWDRASKIKETGGLACKHIWSSYSKSGVAGLEGLSGNFVILLFDRSVKKLFVVTDRWGLFPAFKFEGGSDELVFASHPDALADAVGEGRNWDLTSFAEFVLAGRLSAPFTYYRRINTLPVASTTTLSFADDGAVSEVTRRKYFEFQSFPEPEESLEELAEQFASAFRKAVTRRTLPLFGRSAVALSGGLDSRTVLCAAPNRKDLMAFSFFDEENLELRTAKAIAREAGTEFVALKRDSEYYGEHALQGVRISGGMGCIASNHFLGFRSRLTELGIDNILTGCYCDYLFKGLALNKHVNRLTTRQTINSFDFAFYCGHVTSSTQLSRAVRERQEALFPADIRRYDSEAAVLEVEKRRVFPLSYEEDNSQRTIPQRTMPWYVPIADNELADIFLKMSCPMKLNRALFVRMAEIVCTEGVSRIPDANTGAPVNASMIREAFQSHVRRFASLAAKLKPSNATGGSWLNWNYYVVHSPVVRDLWHRPNPDAEEIFKAVLGKQNFTWDIGAYAGKRMSVFLQLFTLKLWLDQRPR